MTIALFQFPRLGCLNQTKKANSKEFAICHQKTSGQNISLWNSSAHNIMHGWPIVFFQFFIARLSPQIKQTNKQYYGIRQHHVKTYKTYLCVILRPIMSCTDDKLCSSSSLWPGPDQTNKQINNTICHQCTRQHHLKKYLCVILRPIMSCTDDKSRSSSLNVIWFWRFVKCVFVPCLSHLLVPTMRLSRHRELGIVKIKYYIEPLVSLCIMFLHLGLSMYCE